MKEYPERYRRYRSFDEMLQDVLAGKWERSVCLSVV